MHADYKKEKDEKVRNKKVNLDKYKLEQTKLFLIHNKDYIEFVTEFPCLLGHPV